MRREGDGVRHYVHIGTGNYHPQTARLYTDFGLFTCDEQIGADVADMFNFLTGYARPRRYRKVLVAPNFLRDGIIAEIERTVAAHEEGRPARIAMKMNSLVDRRCIRALYRASQAGVPVDLNIRGICCLVPGRRRASRRTSASSRSSGASSSTRGSSPSSATARPRSTSARPTSCRATSTRASSSSRRSRTRSLRDDLLDTLERSLADDTNAWDLGARRRLAPAHASGATSRARSSASSCSATRRARPRAPRPPRQRQRAERKFARRACVAAGMSGRSVCALAVTLAVLAGGAGCGGGAANVALEGRSRARARSRAARCSSARSSTARPRPLQLRAADVRVLDRNGHELSAAAAFSGGYNAGIALRGFGTEMFAAATRRRERRRRRSTLAPARRCR